VDTAVSAATAATIGDGRFRLGIGAGWLEEEFELVGVNFASRFRRLEEIVEVLRLLARGGPAEFHGKHYDFPPVMTNRLPVSYPIVFGGLTAPAIDRAARLGDGWYGVPGLGVDRLQDIREAVKVARGGLDDFAFHVRLSAPFDDAEVETLLSLGFDHLIVPWEALWSNAERRSLPLDGKLERLAAVARRLGLRS
jgi:alkanesulfonate monooxygenase SsuD/methylene tetrahydromethanopterin reductase-like flavin-dependent oxidoreductase (luciferase family)